MSNPISNHSFYTALHTLSSKYGITMNEDEFEDYALYAWNSIGNRNSVVYKYDTIVSNHLVDLPCNCDLIESVHTITEDYRMTDNVLRENYSNSVVESYIESRKRDTEVLYNRGRYVDFTQEGNTLRFKQDNFLVSILYKGYIADENGLPYLNYKEVDAIAAYCAFVYTQKKAFQTKDGGLFQFAAKFESDWRRLADSARSPIYLNQNDMDNILNVSASWDRKRFGVSYKPIR